MVAKGGRQRSLASKDIATRMRDVQERIAQDIADGKLIIRRAYVDSIAADKKSIQARFIDEPGTYFNVPVYDKLPTHINQQVEIAIRDRMQVSIWSIIGNTEVVGTVPSDPPPPTPESGVGALSLASSGSAITATWAILKDADRYVLQYSMSPVFDPTHPTTKSEEVSANTYTVSGLTPHEVWYFRVRGVNVAGPGLWSGKVSIAVSELAAPDGMPPGNSPAVTVTPGLHMLTAKWPVQVNADPVVYEVHIGTVSGFIPDATTKLGETSGTFWITTADAAGNRLVSGTTYFIRVIAKDVDGAAVPGIQGSGSPQVVDLGEAGGVLPSPQIAPDGVVPTAPGAPVVTSGIGYLYLTWAPSSSIDQPTYEVHVSTVSGFNPDANTLSFTTTSRFGFLRRQGSGAGGADLAYGQTYYIKIRGVDADGAGPFSLESSGFTVRTNTADIQVNAITAASGIIADAAIGTAKIVDAAITFAKIGDLQVGTAKISDLAVSNAKIADLAVSNAKIQDLAVTNAKIQNLQASKLTTDVLNATLTISGVVRTADTVNRVEMNSSGFYAYDVNGNATVEITNAGNATFRGTITGGAEINLGGIKISGNTRLGYIDLAKAYIRHIEHRDGLNFRTRLTIYAEDELHLNAGYPIRLQTACYAQWFSAQSVNDQGNRVYSPINVPPYPVTSVNGRTGGVTGLAESGHTHSYTNFSVSGYLQAGTGLYANSILMAHNAGAPTLFNNGGNTRIATQDAGGILYVQNKAATGYSAVYASAFTVQSAGEAKRDIAEAPSALAVAKKLRPVTFKRNTPGGRTERGFIAEEVRKIDPLLVVDMLADDPTDPDQLSTIGLDVAGLAATALHAVKELAAEVAELRGQINPPAPR